MDLPTACPIPHQQEPMEDRSSEMEISPMHPVDMQDTSQGTEVLSIQKEATEDSSLNGEMSTSSKVRFGP